MKKIIALVLAVVMLLCSTAVFADETTQSSTITLQINNKIMTKNSQEIELDVPAQLIDDRTMVPLRAIFEALDAIVTWDDATQTAIGEKNGVVVKITIDSNTMYVNEKAIQLDVPAQLVEDRTLVPVRAISEAFGCLVTWDDATETVVIMPDATAVDGPLGARATLDEFMTAVCDLNLEKASTYLTEDFKDEELPFKNITEVREMFNEEFAATVEMDGYEEEFKPLIDLLIDIILNSFDYEVVNIAQDGDNFVCTVNFKCIDVESIDTILNDEDIAVISETIAYDLILNGKITVFMSEEEMMDILVPELVEAITDTIRQNSGNLGTTSTELELTLVQIDGKWLVESSN